MHRRTLLSAALSLAAIPLMNACKSREGTFTIEWDEEVQLHNGKVIVVHVKRTFYYHPSAGDGEWDGFQSSVAISFDAGGSIGQYSREFVGYQIFMIQYDRDNWYLRILESGYVPEYVTGSVPFLILKPDGSEAMTDNWRDIPYFRKKNLMPVYPSVKAIAQFNNTYISIQQKEDYILKVHYVPGLRNVDDIQPLPEGAKP